MQCKLDLIKLTNEIQKDQDWPFFCVQHSQSDVVSASSSWDEVFTIKTVVRVVS